MVAVATLGLVVIQVPNLHEVYERSGRVWEFASELLLVALLACVVLERVLPLNLLRLLWSTAALTALGLTWSWGFIVDFGTLWPWTWSITAGAVGFAVVAWPWPLAMLFTALYSAAPAVSEMRAEGTLGAETGWQVLAYSGNVAFVAIFVAIRRQLEAVWESERLLEEANEALTVRQAARESEMQARAYVHDEILSLLTAAAITDGPIGADLRAQTHRTRTALERRIAGYPLDFEMHEAGARVTARQFADDLTTDIEALAPDIALHVEQASGTVPHEVVLQMRAAAREALRNSITHAVPCEPRRSVRREVTLRADDAHLRIVIQDDGRGFDVAAVPTTRLGVSGSILGRMAALRGGSASIDSNDSAGTRVTLDWTRP